MISVIVPAYNYAQYLGDALDSVLAQTRGDWECVIVDDGSTDATPEVARAYAAKDSRFRVLRQENRGPSAARNAALRHARGEYVQFLDADDRLAADKLALHGAFLDANPGVDVVYSATTFFRSEEPERELYSLHGHLSQPLMEVVSTGAEALEKLQTINIMPVLAALVRRGAVDRAGGFNEAARGNEDWDFWLRCAMAGCEFRYLRAPRSVAFIRIHAESSSRSGERMLRGLIAGARTFSGSKTPLVYEMAAGVDDVEHGRRLAGMRRIARAARAATSPLVRLRWYAYAAAGALLPRRAFLWLVTRPMPERGLELLRRLRITKTRGV